MLRIKFNSPLLALIATCGLAVSSAALAANPLPPYPASPPAPGGGHGGGPGGGHGGGGGGGFGGGGHSAPGGGGGFGGGGHSAPAPAPAPGHDGFPGAGGVHGTPHGNPGGNPGGGFHPAPAPVHPAPAPFPGGNHGGNPGGGHDGFPGGNHGGGNPGFPGGGYHPAPAPAPMPAPVHPAPVPAPFPGGNHGGNPGGGHDGFPGGNHGGNPGFPGGNHGGNPGGGHDGFPGPGGVHGTPHGFPVGHTHGPGYSYGHDGHGNIVSPIYHDHMDFGRRRMDDMRRDSRVRVIVDRRAQDWRLHDRDAWVHDNDRFARYHDSYRDRYRPWWNEGFYGGCYWEFHPYYDIDTYFYDPMVYWFYADADDYYYRTWYGADYDRYPVFKTRYHYTGAFFPTEEFRDLNLGVSAMGIEAQANYLDASTFLGDSLNSEIKSRGGSSLGEKSVVINHYQVLPDDAGVVVEGYVDQDDVQFSFKTLLDLKDPDSSSVFAVSSDDEMSDQRLDDLRQLNTQIEDMGGVAEGASDSDQSNLGN